MRARVGEALSVIFTVLTSALLLPATAVAQNAPSEPLTEVVVTAQFRAESVHDTPLAISALSSEMLEQKGLTDVVGAANLAPNVALSRGASGFGQMASMFIRGVGQADPHFAVEPGVGMYVDDVYYGVLTGAVFQLLDVERVEVLRGPQGTLAGKNSIGGAIKLFSKRPGPESDGYAELSYGRFDRITGRAAGNLTLIDDKLYARLAVAGNHSDGYFDRLDYGCVTGNTAAGTQRQGLSCKIGTEGGEDVWTARGSLRWLPSDAIENTLIFDVVRDTSENPAAKTLVQSPLWTGGANYVTGAESYTAYENFVSRPGGAGGSSFTMPSQTPLYGSGISNLLSWNLTDSLQLHSITGYRKSNVELSSSLDGAPASIIDQLWHLEHRQFTQELRLSGNGNLLEWTVGAYYYEAKGSSGGRVNIPGGLAPGGGGLNLQILFEDPVDTDSKSAFVHTVWHPAEKLSVIAAVRYTEDEKTFTFNRYDTNGNPHPTLGALLNFPVAYSGDRTDYRVGLDYTWTTNFMTYAQVSTGYKGGGVNPRPFFTTQALTYDPETLDAYEIGLKSRLFERRVSLNTAVFYNRYKDFQGTLLRCDAFSPFPGAPCTMSTNVGDADIKGVELEAQIQPTEALTIDASVGYLDFQYQNVIAATGVTRDMTNIYTPDFTAAAGVAYQFNLGTAGSLTPRLDYSYRSEIYTDAVNTPITRISPQGLLNAKLTWRAADGGWEASLASTNVTDAFYYESQAMRASAPYFSGTGRPGRPREYLVTLKRNFD